MGQILTGETAVDTTIADKFKQSGSGTVISPEDPGYDDARKVWNGMIEKRPALIVQPGSVSEVVVAVKNARDLGLRISVRGGGHNVSGNALNDGGVVIDLRHMRAV